MSTIVLVRSMAEHAFGVFSLLYSFIPIVTTLGSLGLDHTLRRFQPEYLRNGRAGVAAWLLNVVRIARFGSNLIIISAVLLAWNWVAPWFKFTEYRADFIVFAVLILLYFQVLLLQYSLSSHMLHQASVGSIALLSVAKLIAYISLSYPGELTLRNAIYADTLAYAAAFAFLLFVHARKCSVRSGRTSPDVEDKRRMKRYAGFSHLNDSTSLLVYSETDRFFIAALLSPIAVGAYAFYTRLSEMTASFIPQRLFDNLVQPMFFGIAQEEADHKIPRFFTLLVNLNLVYQLPLIVFTSVYHREIVETVFGGKFLEESFLLPVIVAFSTTGNVLAVPLTLVAQYKEKTSLILMSQAAGFYQVAAMFILVPFVGLVGAATATGTFNLLRNLFVWWHVRRTAVWLNWPWVMIMAVLIWGCAGALSFAIATYTAMPAIVEMVCGIAVCGAGILVYLRSPAVCDSDRAILRTVLHGREGKILRWIGILE